MAGDGAHISDYDPGVTDAILGETAHLLRNLGFAADHAILIGGLVPGLLVLDPGREAHAGTTDLDFCLSVALVEGDTAEYDRIEAALKAADYEPTEDSFRWRRRSGLRLTVEFFCPAGDGRPAGRLFRPRAANAPVPKHNMGPTLSAFALEAGEAISADVELVEREVTLPDGAGTVRWTFRVSGLLGFIAAKVAALVGRDKPKDAYDIVWLLEAWPDGPQGAALAARGRPALKREDVQASLARLADAFADADRIGARSYARFTVSTGAPADEVTRAARQASGAVQAFVGAITRAS